MKGVGLPMPFIASLLSYRVVRQRALISTYILFATIRSVIEPFDSRDMPRFIVQGADVAVGSRAVLPLAMSLNELCTNAVKYGALSNASGRINITSVVDEKAQGFKLTWMEMGGPAVHKPTRRSFGTRLIEALAGQLYGDVRLSYQPAGRLYELDIPLAAHRPFLLAEASSNSREVISPIRIASQFWQPILVQGVLLKMPLLPAD